MTVTSSSLQTLNKSVENFISSRPGDALLDVPFATDLDTHSTYTAFMAFVYQSAAEFHILIGHD